MPIVNYGDEYDSIGTAAPIDMTATPGVQGGVDDPSTLATMGAAFRQENIVGSTLTNETMGMNRLEREEGFNPLDEIVGTPYEARAMEAAGIFNRRYFEGWKRQIDRETEDRKTLEAAGWLGTGASAVAAILDLPTLLPGGAAVRGATGGLSIARTAATTAIAGGIGATAAEVGLQATQETRTGLESAIGIGSGIVFGGLLGGGVGAVMSQLEKRAAVRAIDGVRQAAREGTSLTPVADEVEGIARAPAPGGAAVRDLDTLDDLSVAGRATSTYAKSIAQLNPTLRALNSPSVAHRRIMSDIMENPVYLKMNIEGRGGAAVETLQKQWDRGAYGSALERHLDIWKEARAAGIDMSREDFSRAVGRAARRGDTGENEFVTRAAQEWRKRVVDPLKQGAQETGQLPKDLPNRFDETYLHRVYRRDKLISQEPEFKETIRPYIENSIEKAMQIDAGKAERKVVNLRREVEEREMGILRRQEGFRQREEGGEIDLEDGATESDVINMIRQIQSGTRPKEPQRLTTFLRTKGLYDPGGDLAAIGLGPRSAPGLVRATRATASQKGGLGLDDAAYLAWEEGFFPGWQERPTVREFLDALDEDFNRGRRVVREEDFETAAALDRLTEVEAQLTRMGVDLKSPKFATSDDMRGFAAKVNKALDDLDRQKIAELRARLQSVESEAGNLKDPFVSPEDRQDYIEGIVQDVFNKLTGLDQTDIPYGLVSAKQGPLKERTLNVPDRVLEPWLEDDVELVNKRYARKMSADVEIARKYGRADMQDQIAEVVQDYEKLKVGVTDEKRLRDLNKREKSDIADIKAVRDLLRGNYRPEDNSTNFARVMRAAGQFNYLRAMGGVVVSSLTDAVRPAMVHGLTAYMKDGIAPLIRNLDAVKLSVKDAKLAGAISERILQSRMATLAELTDPYSANSPFERFLENMTVNFSKLTGMNHWNDGQKAIASVMTQNRVLRNLENGPDRLKPRERAYMGYLGVDEDIGNRILSQFREHGQTLDGVRVANTEEWSDDIARRAYYAAINKDVDTVIVTKGVGDVPLFVNTPIGRALIQFKSFALASNQRVLMRGMQEGPGRFIGGMAGMTALGMLVYWLKTKEAGREVSNNPGTWVAEGLDRTGIFSIGFEINNTLEKAGAPGVYAGGAALGRVYDPGADAKEPASRFATRSVVEGFMGPSFGMANDVVSLSSMGFKGAQGEGDLTPSDISTMRRLFPYASLPMWRWAIDGGFGLQDSGGFKGVVPELKEAVE